MSISELLKNAQFVVDNAGNRKAVQLDLSVWEELIRILEDLDDLADIEQARQETDTLIPWEQVAANYKSAHPDTDV